MIVLEYPGIKLNSESQSSANYVYHISANKLNDEGSLTCDIRIIVNGTQIIHEKSNVAEWSQKSMMLSGFASNVYKTTSANTSQNTFIATQDSLRFIGLYIWNIFHDEKNAKALWNCWKSIIERDTPKNKYILLSGDFSPISLPLECIRYAGNIGIFISKYHIPIVRAFEANVLYEFPEVSLPSKVITFLGRDASKSLGVISEIKEWAQLLEPDKLWTDDVIRYQISRGLTLKSNPSLGDCSIDIISTGRIDDLKTVVDEQSEPFIFMYLGHGQYPNDLNYRDGDLVYDPSINPLMHNYSNSHDEIMHLLRSSNVKAILFYCCEGLRNFEADILQKSMAIEDQYFYKIRQLKLLSAFRSKVSDLNMQILSRELILSILNKHTLLQYYAGISHNDIYSTTKVIAERSARDHVSQVTMVRME